MLFVGGLAFHRALKRIVCDTEIAQEWKPESYVEAPSDGQLSNPSCQADQDGCVCLDKQLWSWKAGDILTAGPSASFLILDFDRTITTCFLENGNRCADSHDILASHPKITAACRQSMEKLMEKYYPIETDPHMSMAEKTPYMVEWYTMVNRLLLSQGLTRDDVASAVEQCMDFQLRKGVVEVFQLAHQAGIPVVVLSAGLGNIIEEVLRQRIPKPDGTTGTGWENVYVLSNTLLWDSRGEHIGFSEPIIHPFNKSLRDAPADLRQLIAGRDRVLLCGDGLGDLAMDQGHSTSTVLRVGFLNERVDARVAQYTAQSAYDSVVLNDGSFDPTLNMLRLLCDIDRV